MTTKLRSHQVASQSFAPWADPVPTAHVADIFAIQAVAKGIANDIQQTRAFEYIVHALCEIDRMSFYPGAENGRRASDFAEGKRWVGIQLRRIEKLRPERPFGEMA